MHKVYPKNLVSYLTEVSKKEEPKTRNKKKSKS